MKKRWFILGGVLAMAAALYARFGHPLQEQDRNLQGRIALLKEQIASDHAGLDELKAMAPLAAEAKAEFDQVRNERPAASASTWFPKIIDLHFREHSPVTRYSTAKRDPRRPGTLRTYWIIELPLEDPSEGIGRVLNAMTRLERAEPDARIIQLATRREPGPEGKGRATVTLSMLVRE